MTTTNAVGNALSGTTGTGSFVGATSPTLVTPALGTPVSGSLTNCTGYPGALLNVQPLSSSSGTYTPTSGTNTIYFELQGDGGGSGAVTGTSGTKAGCGSGGASGGYLLIKVPASTVGASTTYTVGQGGIAGTTVPAVPGSGSGTTLVLGANTWIAVGGAAGANSVAAVGNNNTNGGAAASNTTFGNATIIKNIGSAAGANGLSSTGSFVISGMGGSSPLGQGGQATLSAAGSSAVGNSGTGYGSGGAGAWSDVASTNRAGAPGLSGIIIAWEYS